MILIVPDVRLLRPKNLVIHDNLKKEIFILLIFLKMKKSKLS